MALVKQNGASHGLLPAQRPGSPDPADAAAIRHLHLGNVCDPQSSLPEMVQGEVCYTEANSTCTAPSPNEIEAPDDVREEISRVIRQDVSVSACGPCDSLCPGMPAKGDFPDTTLGSERVSPPLRPLSPLGKVIKASKMPPCHVPPVDTSFVKSRYLQYDATTTRSRTLSPNRQVAHERHYAWKLGKMYADVPDYKRSQPRMYESRHCLGTDKDQHVVTLKQVRQNKYQDRLDLLCPSFCHFTVTPCHSSLRSSNARDNPAF